MLTQICRWVVCLHGDGAPDVEYVAEICDRCTEQGSVDTAVYASAGTTFTTEPVSKEPVQEEILARCISK